MRQIAIIGIHTGIGKTIASAVICEALKADYWKPVQAGGLDETDTMVVGSLLSNGESILHKEAYVLSEPVSPHLAARIDGTMVELGRMRMPATDNILVVETAGGLMSPLNETQTNLDLILHFKLPVILVSQHYLGSINHTLLTCEVLKRHGVEVKGILFNGEENVASSEYILKNTGYTDIGCMGNIALSKESTKNEAGMLADNLLKIIL